MMNRWLAAALSMISICAPMAALAGPVQAVATEAVVGAAIGVAQLAGADGDKAKNKPKIAAPSKLAKRSPIQARPMPYEARLVVFPFDPDYIYPIPTKLDTYTHIQLAENERVVGFYLSDTLRWKPKVAATRRDIFVKATMPHIEAVATLITNQRRYQLSFSAGDEDDGGLWYQRVSWESDDGFIEAPGDTSARLVAEHSAAARGAVATAASATTTPALMPPPGVADRVDVDKLNFNYALVGDAPFKPTQVFDDGRFTWFKFPRVQDMPVLFALNPSTGEAQVEAFIPRKGYFLVQGLLPGGALLKLGSDEVRVVNNKGQDANCGWLFQRDCASIGNINRN